MRDRGHRSASVRSRALRIRLAAGAVRAAGNADAAGATDRRCGRSRSHRRGARDGVAAGAAAHGKAAAIGPACAACRCGARRCCSRSPGCRRRHCASVAAGPPAPAMDGPPASPVAVAVDVAAPALDVAFDVAAASPPIGVVQQELSKSFWPPASPAFATAVADTDFEPARVSDAVARLPCAHLAPIASM